MHEVIPGAYVEGKVRARRRGPLRPRRRPGRRAPPDRHGLPAAQPVPHDVDLRQRDRGHAAEQQRHDASPTRTTLVERSLRGANLWNEVKDRLDKPGSGLSGGQQQRLCIARAIAVQPDVLLMDEPCSALDPISTLAIEDLINELKKDYTIVIVTHNMQQAARVSDYTGVLQHRGHRQARQARRDGRDQDDLLPARRRRRPRTTSPAASADISYTIELRLLHLEGAQFDMHGDRGQFWTSGWIGRTI